MPASARPVSSSAPGATLSRGRTVHLTAAGLCLIAACYGLARFAYGLFVPVFREAFDLDAAVTGAIASASYVAYCAGVIVSAALTPRLGARAVAVGAGCLATLGTALIGVAPGAAVLTLGVVIAGSSTGVASPPLAHVIAHRVAAGVRDRIQTTVNAGTGLGVLVSGPVALLLQGQWRGAWLVFACIAAGVTVWVALAVPAARAAPGDAAWPEGHERASHAPLPKGSSRLLAAAAVMGTASASTWTFGQDLLVTVGGHSPTASTIAWITLGACGLLGAATGSVTGRIGLPATWLVSMLGLGATTAVLATAPEHYLLAVTASGLFGGLYIALTGILLIWSTQVFDHQPARGVGAAFLLLAIGQAGAAPLLGALADRTDLTAAFWAATVLALIGSLLAPSPTRSPTRERA